MDALDALIVAVDAKVKNARQSERSSISKRLRREANASGVSLPTKNILLKIANDFESNSKERD
jgi:ketopantoate reductase